MIALFRLGAFMALLILCLAPPFEALAATGPGKSVEVEQPPDVTEQLTPQEIDLKPQTVAFLEDDGDWDDSADMLNGAFKTIYASLAKANIHATGAPLVEYIESDDTKFSFRAMVPIEKPTVTITLGSDVEIGEGPSGKALKFVHRGSFDELDQVYNRIDDYLSAKGLEMQRVVEEYVTDQTVTSLDSNITSIYIFTE